jgi:hypothetical protein
LLVQLGPLASENVVDDGVDLALAHRISV